MNTKSEIKTTNQFYHELKVFLKNDPYLNKLNISRYKVHMLLNSKMYVHINIKT